MRFQVLGPLRVTVGDKAIALGAPQQQKLLALLCATPNQPITTDRLISEIWGEYAPPSARHLVQVYVSRLRKLLGDLGGQPRIDRRAAGYLLRAEADEVDSLQFAALAVAARKGDDPAATWQILGDAIKMWRGVPFGELADESDYLRLAAIRLTEAYVCAVEDRIGAGLDRGYHRELIGELEGLILDHPYRERFWQQLMIALYRSDRQVEALRAFRALRAKLGEDLGLEPGRAASELEGRILLHDHELLWEPPPPRSTLPASRNAFIGRATEVAMVGKLLETSRVVTLTGPGGIGKTRLAIESARRFLDRFADGVWWIDLAPLSAGDAVVTAIARALGVSAQPDKTMTESVVQSLVRRNVLLVVDNCEHVVPAVAEFAAAALRTTDRVRILATSRVPLHISAESLWIVPPLSMPGRDDDLAVGLPHSDAVQLFVDRGGAAAPTFQLDGANAADVTEVCRRLDGIPLGIEMAAAQLRVMSPGEISDALGNRFEVLAQPDRDKPARHKTLQAAFNWSYDLLDPETRTAFDNLAVFPGSFDLDAAREVAFSHVSNLSALEVMSVLVESSMVTTVGSGEGGMRFRLLETLRGYGAGHLRQSDALDRISSRHAAYFTSLFSGAAQHIGEPEFVSWMRRLDDCYADVQQALDRMLQSRKPADAFRLAPPLAHYWYRTGDARQARLWGLRMLESPKDVASELVAAAHAAVAFGTTILVEDPADAISHAERAIELYRRSPDQRGLIFGLFGRANAALLIGDVATVRIDALEGLALADEIEYSWGRGVCLSMLAFADYFGGEALDGARANAVAGVSYLRAAGDLGGQVVFNLAAAIALKQGDFDGAERYALDTAGIAVGSGWEAAALDVLAQVYIAKNEIDRAESTLQRAVLRSLDVGLENWFRVALRDLAQIACRRANSAKAARLLGASRRNMPMWGLDPVVYEAVETACRDALGAQAFSEISTEGYETGIAQLLDLVMPA